MSRVCLLGRLTGHAGPAMFQRRLVAGLERREIGVTYDPEDPPYEAMLVIGGTRRLSELRSVKSRGVRIVQRLNGMNWMHRQMPTGLKHALRAEANNILLRTVRDRFADHVVYQSEFARDWWTQRHGAAQAPSTVVYNGVPLEDYSPIGEERPPEDRIRILMVEGNYAGGYETGLETGAGLRAKLAEVADRPVELTVAGRVPAELRDGAGVAVTFLGQLDPGAIPALNRSAHLLFSGDLNPACPNSVIEAIACGTPVIAYDTGSLSELVQNDSGRLADYGGDPWTLEPPDVDALARAAMEVLDEPDRFRAGARSRAEAAFGVDEMVGGYLAALDLS